MTQFSANNSYLRLKGGLLWATNCLGNKFNVPWQRWRVCDLDIQNYVNWRIGWDESFNDSYLLLTKNLV